MVSKKRRTIIHRIQKTEIKNYTMPQEKIIITFPKADTNWLTELVSYPRYIILLISMLLLSSILGGL